MSRSTHTVVHSLMAGYTMTGVYSSSEEEGISWEKEKGERERGCCCRRCLVVVAAAAVAYSIH